MNVVQFHRRRMGVRFVLSFFILHRQNPLINSQTHKVNTKSSLANSCLWFYPFARYNIPRPIAAASYLVATERRRRKEMRNREYGGRKRERERRQEKERGDSRCSENTHFGNTSKARAWRAYSLAYVNLIVLFISGK